MSETQQFCFKNQVLLAFNKVDRVDSENLALAQQKYPQAVFISATQKLGLDTLKNNCCI